MLSRFLDPFWGLGPFLMSLDPPGKHKNACPPPGKTPAGPMCNITLGDGEVQAPK